MFRNLHTIAARSLLAVLIAVTGSGTPAIRHAHAGGDVQHTHGHSGKHCHRHHRHDHPRTASKILSTCRHLHVALLGFQLTMPCNPNERNSDEDGYPKLASLIEHSAVPAGKPVAETAHVAVIEVPCRIDVAAMPMVATSSVKASGRNLLCDAARHERSGVQLS